MGKFDEKKLLILGTSVGSVEIIKYARSEGAYVIVTDYLPVEKSAAKMYADETAMISTTDIDALCKFASEKQIDGVFCGVSEVNLVSVQRIASSLGLPCYFTKEQWDLCQNKERFKKLCEQFGIPVPKDYTSIVADKGIIDSEVLFPVIVKPVDSSAGRGITICYNSDELSRAYQYAMACSPSKRVLVEEYVTGEEFSVTYTVNEGKVSVSCSKDKLFTEDYSPVFSQFDILIMPSKYQSLYINEVHEKVEKLFKHIDSKYGSIMLQGVVRNGIFSFFEMCYRINGGSDYRHIEKENGINYLHMMVDHALNGQAHDFDLSKDNPFFSNIYVTLNIYSHGGVIGKMEGMEKVREMPGVINAEYLRDVGDEVVDNKTLMQRVFRAYISSDNIESIKKTIEEIQKVVKVEDIVGKNMLYKHFDVTRLDGYGGHK